MVPAPVLYPRYGTKDTAKELFLSNSKLHHIIKMKALIWVLRRSR